MLAGMFRFVCKNGLVCGDAVADVRFPHRGNVVDHVIEGAFEVVRGFARVAEAREAMRAITLSPDEMEAFGCAALAVKYGTDIPRALTERLVLASRRDEDKPTDLWTVFNRVQENLVKGGLPSGRMDGRGVPGLCTGFPPTCGLIKGCGSCLTR